MEEDLLSKLTSRLIELESKYPVEKWKMAGIHIWPLFRFAIIRTNRGRDTNKETVIVQHEHFKIVIDKILAYGRALLNLFDGVRASIVDRIHNDKVVKGNVILLTQPSNRRLLVDGRHFDVFMDPVALWLEKKGRKVITIEEGDDTGFQTPRYRPSWIIDGTVYLLKIIAPLFIRSPEKHQSEINYLPYYDEIVMTLSSDGYDTSAVSKPRLKSYVERLLKRSQAYQLLIKYLKARAVIVAGYTKKSSLSFILAARRENVTVIDLQHGVHGAPMRWAYDWSKFPDSGYEVLPDIFWCWSEEEAAEINTWPKSKGNRHKAFIGGNHLMNMIMDGSIHPNSKIAKEFRQVHSSLSSELHILISIQPDYINFDFLDKLLSTAPPNWSWWIRLHPRMLSQRKIFVNKLKKRNKTVFVNYPTDTDLYTVLKHMDIHLTHSSSVTIEAAHMGIPTIVWSKLGERTFSAYSDSGKVHVAKDVVGIISTCYEFIPYKPSYGESRY